MTIVSNISCPTNCGDLMPQTFMQPRTPLLDVPNEVVTAIANHIHRYRLSVFSAMTKLPVFAGQGSRQVKHVLAECCRRSILNSASLHERAKYWYLDAGGVAYVGSQDTQMGPLSEPAKLRALAILRFCCLSERPRHHLMPCELKTRFPDVARPGLPDGYYFDPHGNGRIGLIRIDAGRKGRWDRIVQSIRRDIETHLQNAGFRRLTEAGCFEISILTIFRQKAQRLREALASHTDSCRVPVRIVAMPELLSLLSCRR